MAKDRDNITGFIDAMERRVSKMESEVMEAVNKRGETIGTALLKAGIGSPMLISGIAHIDRPEGAISFVAGLALTAWGLRDATQLPERFRRVRELTTNSRLLRTTLTSNIADAIQTIPFKNLEASDKPSLPAPKNTSNP